MLRGNCWFALEQGRRRRRRRRMRRISNSNNSNRRSWRFILVDWVLSRLSTNRRRRPQRVSFNVPFLLLLLLLRSIPASGFASYSSPKSSKSMVTNHTIASVLDISRGLSSSTDGPSSSGRPRCRAFDRLDSSSWGVVAGQERTFGNVHTGHDRRTHVCDWLTGSSGFAREATKDRRTTIRGFSLPFVFTTDGG